ncbi:MAG: GTPase HflX [Simkaniaceae bacterium]|nr:GTPase HflX [Simkaniaceae bacterium]
MKTAFLIGVVDNGEDTLDELEALADTFGLSVIRKEAVKLRKFDAATYIGSGKAEEFAKFEVDVVIFDDNITPNQQRNLEKIFNKPVMDRTELILGVFAARAQTKEARLQVELAEARYQLPRLRRMWTHLSRQAGGGGGGGGGGYLKGEGEKQIEIDRRLIRAEIERLKKQLDEVAHHRAEQRKSRLRSNIPSAAIVGYTNAGKSTLLNALTQAGVLAEDKLFATLDTTTRRFVLPNEQPLLLIDTVGFVRKLPHMLVAAFKSTLEETLYTDLLIHVVDVSHPDVIKQVATTLEVLEELGAGDKPMITVLNKVDLLESREIISMFRVKYPNSLALSATTHEGFELLFETIMKVLSNLRRTFHLRIPQSHFNLVSELIRVGSVHSMDYEGNDVIMHVEIPSTIEYKIIPFIADDSGIK